MSTKKYFQKEKEVSYISLSTVEIGKEEYIPSLLSLVEEFNKEGIDLYYFSQNIVPLIKASENLKEFEEELKSIKEFTLELYRIPQKGHIYVQSFFRSTLPKMAEVVNFPRKFERIVEVGARTLRDGRTPCDLMLALISKAKELEDEKFDRYSLVAEILDESSYSMIMKEPYDPLENHRIRKKVLEGASSYIVDSGQSFLSSWKNFYTLTKSALVESD